MLSNHSLQLQILSFTLIIIRALNLGSYISYNCFRFYSIVCHILVPNNFGAGQHAVYTSQERIYWSRGISYRQQDVAHCCSSESEQLGLLYSETDSGPSAGARTKTVQYYQQDIYGIKDDVAIIVTEFCQQQARE